MQATFPTFGRAAGITCDKDIALVVFDDIALTGLPYPSFTGEFPKNIMNLVGCSDEYQRGRADVVVTLTPDVDGIKKTHDVTSYCTYTSTNVNVITMNRFAHRPGPFGDTQLAGFCWKR